MPPLTHYTGSLEAVSGILTYGFAWYPNSRRLSELLLPTIPLRKREPQQFGMVSFTELSPVEAGAHKERFGPFGIAVSEAWAARHRAQRVFYVPTSGPLTEALQRLFEAGAQDLANRLPVSAESRFHMSYENRALASTIAGAGLWRNLLTIWEYLEPEDSAAQREWRIVNPEPDYTDFGTKPEAIQAVSPPENWAKFNRVLPISSEEVVHLVCPHSRLEALRASLPPAFTALPVLETDG